MVIYKSDFTDYAHEIGVWEALCEQANVNPRKTTELEVLKVKKPTKDMED